MIAKTSPQAETVLVPAGGVHLVVDLVVPDRTRAVVLFAQGSGGSRGSPGNRFVARQLRTAGLATLLVDLLSTGEQAIEGDSGSSPVDLDLLAERLESVAGWVSEDSRTRNAPLAYFGGGSGAAAALLAAAGRPDRVGAIVSRGGLPDLARGALAAVSAPTLLIVGGHDEPLIQPTRRTLEALRCEKKLAIVPGATHLVEEAAALEQVAELAAMWFLGYLSPPVRSPSRDP